MTTLVVATLAAGSLLFGQEAETATMRLLKSSEADQIAYLNNYIAEGVPMGNDSVGIMVRSKTSLFVPLLEQKIEEIAQSRSPQRLFKGPSADVRVIVARLASMIEETGEEVALEQASKLIKIDEDLFGSMVEHCLGYAFSHGKGFQLAYRGLKIGDPAVDKRIMAWVDIGIGDRDEINHTIILRQWADAAVEEYNGAPDEYRWAKDPIVSRLSADRLNPPGGLPLRDEMFRRTAEAAQKRLKR